jgi:hypothetical protein
MEQEEYLKNRVDDQIDWYDRKSASNQWWFYRLRIVEIIAAAAVPLLAGYADFSVGIKVLVGFLGGIVAVIAGVLALYQFQENWTTYRSVGESLKQEKHLFLTKTAPYDGSNPFPLVVQRMESIMSKERTAWMHTRPAGKDKNQE